MRRATLGIVALLSGIIAFPLGAQAFGDNGGKRLEFFRQRMQERIQQMDTDHNGAISKEEFMAHAKAQFDKMDTNGDGQITESERAAMREKFDQLREEGGLGDKLSP